MVRLESLGIGKKVSQNFGVQSSHNEFRLSVGKSVSRATFGVCDNSRCTEPSYAKCIVFTDSSVDCHIGIVRPCSLALSNYANDSLLLIFRVSNFFLSTPWEKNLRARLKGPTLNLDRDAKLLETSHIKDTWGPNDFVSHDQFLLQSKKFAWILFIRIRKKVSILYDYSLLYPQFTKEYFHSILGFLKVQYIL